LRPLSGVARRCGEGYLLQLMRHFTTPRVLAVALAAVLLLPVAAAAEEVDADLSQQPYVCIRTGVVGPICVRTP
jgi:hypothetical protein